MNARMEPLFAVLMPSARIFLDTMSAVAYRDSQAMELIVMTSMNATVELYFVAHMPNATTFLATTRVLVWKDLWEMV